MKTKPLFSAALFLFGFIFQVNAHFTPDTSLVVTTINEYPIDGQWSLIDREILGYDEERRKLFRSFESIADIEEFRELWQYEDNMQAEKVLLIEDLDLSWRISQREIINFSPFSDTIITQARTGDEFVNAFREIINYNEAGKVTEETRYELINEQWVAQVRHTYEYDDQENLIRQITQQRELDDVQLVNLRKVVNTYENERIQTSFAFQWSRDEEEWVGTTETYYTYTTKCRKLISEELTQRIIDGQNENFRRIFDTTAVNGLLTGSLRQIWEDDEWADDLRRLYTYDFMGNVILELRQVPENSAWVDLERTRYEYAYYLDQNSTKLASQQLRNKISVAENRNEIRLTGLSEVGSTVMCRIYDLKGRVLFSESIPVANSNSIRIRKNGTIASGIRIVQLSTKGNDVIYRGKITY